jgi:hypothetical protein
MIKKTAILLIAAIVVGFSTSIAASRLSDPVNVIRKVSIDNTKPVSLDFSGAKIQIQGGGNTLQIIPKIPIEDEKYKERFGSSYDLVSDGNIVRLQNYVPQNISSYILQTWLTLAQFEKFREGAYSDEYAGRGLGYSDNNYDFIIYVPKNVPVIVKARYVKTWNCTIAAVTAREAELRESILAEGFTGEGDRIVVRDSKVSEDSTFNFESREMRDNTIVKD